METLSQILGGLGVALLLLSQWLKGMLPLRQAALAAALCLLALGALRGALPALLLGGALALINLVRLLQLRRQVRAIQSTRVDAPLSAWLLPHMQRRTHKAGELLWRQGALGDEMLYLAEGQLLLEEHAELLWPDSLVGESALFAPDSRRALSLRCKSDCVVYALSAARLQQLHFENPKLGFHVMRLLVARLMHDVNKAGSHGALAQTEALA